jgi:folate-binding protein YgfZ
VRVAGLTSLDALEVRAWRPSRRGEVDERAIPHELDWLRTAVHLNKGCYRGQETIAKVHNLGHPPRRLVLLHLDGSGGELPTAGALVYPAGAESDARPVGRVTRSALHYEWGGIALALLKRSVPEDAELEVALGDARAASGDNSTDSGNTAGDGSAADDSAHTSPSERIAAAQEVIVPSDAGRTRDIPRLKRLG